MKGCFRMKTKIKHAVMVVIAVITLFATAVTTAEPVKNLGKDDRLQQVSYDWIEGTPHRFECTGYYPGGICANGEPAEPGVVAVDPNIIPLGTWIYVEVDGRPDLGIMCLKACDTGGTIQGYIIDICTHDPYGIGRRGCTVWY